MVFLFRFRIIRRGYQTTICKSEKLIILLISCVTCQRSHFFHSGVEWSVNQNQLAKSNIKHCFVPMCLSWSYSTPSHSRSSVSLWKCQPVANRKTLRLRKVTCLQNCKKLAVSKREFITMSGHLYSLLKCVCICLSLKDSQFHVSIILVRQKHQRFVVPESKYQYKTLCFPDLRMFVCLQV